MSAHDLSRNTLETGRLDTLRQNFATIVLHDAVEGPYFRGVLAVTVVSRDEAGL
jgi:hypothetical protein